MHKKIGIELLNTDFLWRKNYLTQLAQAMISSNHH